MSNELYFISLISEAIQKPQSLIALRKAFERIIEMGEKPAYERGYKQFLRFMKTGLDIHRKMTSYIVGMWEHYADQQSGFFQAAFNIQQTERAEKIFLETLRRPSEKFELELIVTINGEMTASLPMKPFAISHSIINAMPGFYTFQLSTGRFLWMGKLTKRDLFWAYAFPNSDIKLAADTEDSRVEPTKEFGLLDGEIVIHVFPGFDGGCIEIKGSK